MRYIGRYDLAATPSFASLAAASTVARRAHLAALQGKIDAAAAHHAAALPHVEVLAPANVTAAEKTTLVDGYDGRSAAVKRRLETMRQSLGQAHLDLCPFCSLETTGQLDHYLPKQRFPEFALYGPNLLPICPLCNQSKGLSVVNLAGERLFLMPTEDTAAQQRVLVADLTILPAPRVTYSIDPNAHLAPDELDLIRRHFERLKLANRYRRRAISLISAIKSNISTAGKVRALAHDAIHHGHASAHAEGPVNSWRTALYDAIVGQATAFEDWLVQ
jgi:hypothetical protein